ncbi:hypothetical protein K501DRAFT_312570 [Backusella circina FSU 941]|nr:hypothetical protein K501DRAFT_312570 [Backusella circina FSU 941]
MTATTKLPVSKFSRPMIKAFVAAVVLIFIMYIVSDQQILRRIEKLEKLTREEKLPSVPRRNGFPIKENDKFLHDFENRDFKFKNYLNIINQYVRLLKTNCVCNKMIIGDIYTDGYKIGCQDLYEQKDGDEKCLVYSLGSNDNYFYETEIYNRYGCEIVTIDQNAFNLPEYIKFQKAKIGSCPECKSINNILAMNNHTNRTITAFKIDIEGAEWDNLDQIFNPQFKQIQMEIHKPDFEKMKKLQKFADKWCLVDVTPNVLSTDCLELVFINKNYLEV